jgi:hypothetical protein
MRSPKIFVLTLVWAALIVLVVHLVDFPGSVPNFTEVSGGGALLDAVPAFTADEVYARLTGYGKEGRLNYSFRNVTVDVLLPLSVLPFLVLLAVRAARPLSRRRILRLLLVSVPFVYVLFDFLENATVLRLVAIYPDRLDFLASSLPYTTMIKRAASLLAIGVPLGMLGFRSWRRSFPNKKVYATVQH